MPAAFDFGRTTSLHPLRHAAMLGWIEIKGAFCDRVTSPRERRAIMPLRSLVAQTTFNSDETEKIGKAFDDAWAQLQGDGTDPAMASLVRTAIAKRIIEMAQQDGVNAQKLRDDAIAYVKNNPLWPALEA